MEESTPFCYLVINAKTIHEITLTISLANQRGQARLPDLRDAVITSVSPALNAFQ